MSEIKCSHCHTRYDDVKYRCPKCSRFTSDNRDDNNNLLSPSAGSLGLDMTGGGLSIGIGGGLSMDLNDGGLNIGGIGLDGD